MIRCFADPSAWHGGLVKLDAEESHHIQHVLRGREGDLLWVFDGGGREAQAKVVDSDKTEVTLQVLEVTQHDRPPVSTVLVQSVLKGQRMDWTIQKATELGVSVLAPVIAQRSVVQLAETKKATKTDRWAKIARNAAKQCGTVWLPQIEPVTTLIDFLSEPKDLDVLLLCSLAEGATPLKRVLAQQAGRSPTSVGVLIGPEGDLTEEETQAAASAGAIAVSLGTLTFRAETAALYALSVLSYELQQA